MELTPDLRQTLERALGRYKEMLKTRIDEPLVGPAERTILSQEIKDVDKALEQLDGPPVTL